MPPYSAQKNRHNSFINPFSYSYLTSSSNYFQSYISIPFIVVKLDKNKLMSSQQKPTKDRIYYSMLQKVGTLGRYQFILGVFIVLVGMEGSACLLINPYIFYQQSFNCPSEIADCKEYVCSLPPELRGPYTPAWDGRTSLANEFGDMRCEGSEFVTLANSIIILGSVLGVFVTIFFTEYLGRKGTTNLGLLTSVIGLGLTLIHSQTSNVIGVFMYSAGLANSFTIITTFIVEFFPEKNNAQYFNLLTLSFAVGTAINPIAFYFIYDWKMVVIFVFLLPTLITLIGFHFIVENTPIELIAADDYNETYNAFMRIAKWNGVEDHGLTLDGVKEIKDEYDENQRKKHAKVFTIVDLFRYKSLRSQFFPMSANRFIIAFLYFAPALLLQTFQLNIYIDGLIIAFSKAGAIFFQHFLLKIERRVANYLLFSITLIFAVGIYLSQTLCHDCENNLVQSIFNFGYRITTSILSFMVILISNEFYPAQVRNLGTVTVTTIGRSSILLVPFVLAFCRTINISFFVLLAIFAALGMVVTYFMAETFGVPAPEMIEEVEMGEHHYQHYDVKRKE